MAYKIPSPSTVLILNRRPVSTTYTANATDELLGIKNASNFTITLPDVATLPNGKVFIIADETGSLTGHTVTINTVSGNINGGASTTLTTSYGYVRLYVNNSVYWTW